MQIAVTIANPVLLNTFPKNVFIPHIKFIGVMADRFEGGRRNRLANERLDLREIFVGADLQLFGRAPLLDLWARSF